MLIYILVGIAAVIVLFLIVVATRPSTFKITRSATISAPGPLVFEQVNDFHNWEAWSPWARMDPNANNSYIGAPTGEGAMFTWAGNKKVGEGRMTILESQPHQYIRIKLEFLKPFVATNTAEFTFEPAAAGTLVTWSMSGKNNFMAKLFVMLMNCDKMVGGQFEQGLRNMQEVVAGKSQLTTK